MERDFEQMLKISRKYKGISKDMLGKISSNIKTHKNKEYEKFKTVEDALAQGERKQAETVTVFWDGVHYGAICTFGKENAARKRVFKAGRKMWFTMQDSTVCFFCKQLEGQIRNADEPFIARWKKGTRVELQGPPAHFINRGPKAGTPNCRCWVTYFREIPVPEEIEEVEEENDVLITIPTNMQQSEWDISEWESRLDSMGIELEVGIAIDTDAVEWYIKEGDKKKVRNFLNTIQAKYEVG